MREREKRNEYLKINEMKRKRSEDREREKKDKRQTEKRKIMKIKWINVVSEALHETENNKQT